jgi:hypothetical protein
MIDTQQGVSAMALFTFTLKARLPRPANSDGFDDAVASGGSDSSSFLFALRVLENDGTRPGLVLFSRNFQAWSGLQSEPR